ncbi:hypothetical protein [Thalassoporum mexicanum]|uniref:hypothetical protein n=1 Tax=Thalassoporum mexicanum TaxID=3457544 RepID=UPI0012EA80DD|nr:hypothetical protein [Pseudanabaena sp. PCC 7367]
MKNIKESYKTIALSDPDYERLIVEIEINDYFVALLTQEEGPIKIGFPAGVDASGESFTYIEFDIASFPKIVEQARNYLLYQAQLQDHYHSKIIETTEEGHHIQIYDHSIYDQYVTKITIEADYYMSLIMQEETRTPSEIKIELPVTRGRGNFARQKIDLDSFLEIIELARKHLVGE